MNKSTETVAQEKDGCVTLISWPRLKVPDYSPVLFVVTALMGSKAFGYAI